MSIALCIEIIPFSNIPNFIKKFLEFSQGKGLNEKIVKDYILDELKSKNPTTVSHSISIIEFFFSKILKEKIKIPHPKRNKTLPEILTIDSFRVGITKNILKVYQPLVGR